MIRIYLKSARPRQTNKFGAQTLFNISVQPSLNCTIHKQELVTCPSMKHCIDKEDDCQMGRLLTSRKINNFSRIYIIIVFKELTTWTFVKQQLFRLHSNQTTNSKQPRAGTVSLALLCQKFKTRTQTTWLTNLQYFFAQISTV